MKKLGILFLLIEIAVLAVAITDTAFLPDRPNMDAIYLNTEPEFSNSDIEAKQGEETSMPSHQSGKLQTVVTSFLDNFTHPQHKSSQLEAQSQAECYFSICPYAKHNRILAA